MIRPEPILFSILMDGILIIDMQGDAVEARHLLRERIRMVLLHLSQMAGPVDNLIKTDPVKTKEIPDVACRTAG